MSLVEAVAINTLGRQQVRRGSWAVTRLTFANLR